MKETLGRLLAVGNVAEIFEWGSRVVKLYKSPGAKASAFREASLHAGVETMGLPVSRIWGVQEFGERWGLVFDLVEQASFAEQMSANAGESPRYLDCMVRLHIRIHAQEAIQFTDLKVRLATNISATRLLDQPRRHDLLEELAHMPVGDRLCHGDFHPMNIMGDTSQPVIIDWADASRGDAAADVCRSYLLMRLHAAELATPYLDAYCRTAGMSHETVLNWLRYVAAARLAENVPNELDGLLKIVGEASPKHSTATTSH